MMLALAVGRGLEARERLYVSDRLAVSRVYRMQCGGRVSGQTSRVGALWHTLYVSLITMWAKIIATWNRCQKTPYRRVALQLARVEPTISNAQSRVTPNGFRSYT